MDLVETVGENLWHIRLERGMSQTELAAAIGVHRSYVSTIELGRRNLTLRSVDKLASQLEVPVHELLLPRAVWTGVVRI